MSKVRLQLLLLVLLALLCLGGYFTARHILNLPFRSTNDALHKKGAPFTLDFLIPPGTHIDEKISIGEVIQIRFKKQKSLYQRGLRAVSDIIPQRYRLLADMLFFWFWTFCFMAIIRTFTFMGYARSLRASLLLGGITYYFMPDFSPGRIDDAIFLGIPILIILIRIFLRRGTVREKGNEA